MYLTEQPFAFDDHHLRIGGKAVLCQSPAEQTVLQLTPIHVGVVKMLNPFWASTLFNGRHKRHRMACLVNTPTSNVHSLPPL